MTSIATIEPPSAPTREPLTAADLAAIPVTRLVEDPAKCAALINLGIGNAADLLAWYPRRWIDRTNQATISQLRPDIEVVVVGTVTELGERSGKRRPFVAGKVADNTGEIDVMFFNQPWRVRQLPAGTSVAMFGKVTAWRDRLQLTNPVVDLIGDQMGKLIPVYPQSDKEGLTSAEIQRWIARTLDRCRARGVVDPLPRWVIDRYGLPDRWTAMRGIHQADNKNTRNAARARLVFDELFRLQVVLARRRIRVETAKEGIAHAGTGRMLDRLLAGLPFPLTGAQTRVIGEIVADMARPVPMHRLLQGDVGAGKTLVAAAAMLTAVEAGHQAVLLAPTEVLAEQHAAGIARTVADVTVPDGGDGRPITVGLLTNRTVGKRRDALLADLAAGRLDILIGTHAVLEPAVQFRDLSLVVVDEQHRFGVEQRSALGAKRVDRLRPHMLVMTATPIPRTAAMTVYGDLDVSVLDQLPPGRTPIVTRWANGPDAQPPVWDQIRLEVAAGRQAYVVCPLVEESANLEAAGAEATYKWLTEGEFSTLRVGLLHGKMRADAKGEVMDRFRAGDLDVLVATTVIEVGVDVPNATVIAILDADRFGIAQLHQLRGRVGRGRHASTCWLITGMCADGNPRVEALVDSTDGFKLAEVDLVLRGAGAIFDDRQAGRTDLRLAHLLRDQGWLVKAREAAFELVARDPELVGSPELADEISVVFDVDDSWLARS